MDIFNEIQRPSPLLDTEHVRNALIEQAEYELTLAKLEVEKWEKYINSLKQLKTGETVNLKWRSEIRKCLNESPLPLATLNNLADCIATNNHIKVDRNLKLKISSTLSLMFNEGEIGRYIRANEREYSYGNKEYFIADQDGKLTILTDDIAFMY